MRISDYLKTTLWCYLQTQAGAWARLRCLRVCATPEQRARGLIGREGLPADGCLLFAWPQEEEQTFHMRGVRFPVDMIAIGGDRRVARVVAAAQPETPAVVLGRCRWAIECNAGWSAQHDVGVGVRVAFVKSK